MKLNPALFQGPCSDWISISLLPNGLHLPGLHVFTYLVFTSRLSTISKSDHEPRPPIATGARLMNLLLQSGEKCRVLAWEGKEVILSYDLEVR